MKSPSRPGTGRVADHSPLARELGIDLRRIRGSENGGRIVMADVRAYIQRLQRLAAQPRAAGPPAAPAKPSRRRASIFPNGARSPSVR
jgi:pyruvate/2-oxoglutarate dehydrogenase complex dihydrolipoamide acyltransferase (E2) component